ncbi:MAG: N-acetyltransferase [Sedimentisphaerales bacterium]|nr:N-acetyltransferase [Sedimentisphaerales bacterium]
MMIRSERDSDIEAIFEVTALAFQNHPISHQTEQFIVNALRAAGALTISLVAEIDGTVVGHIAFSLVTISDGSRNWYGLGPISVLPAFQRQGIGQALVREGLSQLQSLGAEGCVLVGPPEYYNRFGFQCVPDLTVENVPQQYCLALAFGPRQARGTATHHEAFAATG